MDNINRIVQDQNKRTSTLSTVGRIQKKNKKKKNSKKPDDDQEQPPLPPKNNQSNSKQSNSKQSNSKQSNNKQSNRRQAPPSPPPWPPPQQQVQPQVQPQQPIPQTIILECNRLTSRQDETTADAYSTNHRWKTEFSNGIQIKKGDEIKINSAYISSIGVGDLIAWDNLEGSNTQDNKATWLLSYYGINDALNDKREGYNMYEFAGDVGNGSVGGAGSFVYDIDNSACQLMRNVNQYSEGLYQSINNYMTGRSWASRQDPYLPCRFFGQTFQIKTPVIDNHFIFELMPNLYVALNGGGSSTLTCIRMNYVVNNTTFTPVDIRNVFAIGQTLLFQSQPEPNLTDPNQHYIPNNSQDWCFTVANYGRDSLSQHVLVVDNLTNDVGLIGGLIGTGISSTITAKVLVTSLPYRSCASETNPATLQHTALSTILFSDADADNSNYVNVGDKYKQYSFKSLGNVTDMAKYNNTSLTQFNTPQTDNTVFQCEITESDRTANDCKLEINVETLFGFDGGANHEQRQQQIKFTFVDATLNAQIKAGGIDALTQIVGSNYMMLDLYNPANGGVNREIACYFVISATHNTGSIDNFEVDATTGLITITGVRRSQESTQTNLLTNNLQQETTNINVIAGQKYYVIKTKQLFSDLTAKYSYDDSLQYRANTWDWSLKYASPPPAQNPNYEVPYWVYIKDNDDIFHNYSMGLYNDRTADAENNYSSTFNIFSEYDQSIEVKQILLYDGYDATLNAETISVKHYHLKEFEITQNYSSPANIATAITKQTHDTSLARDNTGLEVPDSKNQGLIQNEFYFPVWSSFGPTNLEHATGKLQGVQQDNSFFLKYDLQNPSPHAYGDSHVPPLGIYEIYFRTKNTCVNRPIGITLTSGSTVPEQTNGRYFTQDLRNNWVADYVSDSGSNELPFNLSGIPPPAGGSVSILPPHIQFAICYDPNGLTPESPLDNNNGFPVEYLNNCHASQYCGSNNISLTWDDANSRFKFDYLHQTAVSEFIATDEGVTQDSGEPTTTIYYPAPLSNTGTPYKLPRTRVGGVNIENWTSNTFVYPSTPAQVRAIAGIDTTIDLSSNWFVTDHHNIPPDTPELQKNYNVIGNRFWNKLGFENEQIYKTNVGSEKDVVTGRYLPKGTTDNLTDIADALSSTKEPTENAPYYNTVGSKLTTIGEQAGRATFEFSSFGSLNTNNHLFGNGLPNTSGAPEKFNANVTRKVWNADYPHLPPVVDQFNQYQSSYNPDRQRHQAYTFTTVGDSLVAGTLPTKTEFPYFLVMSDLIKSDFHVSANQGANLNCLGVISKANAEQDFYFQYQAPQSFYATKDEIVSSITTEIRTPSLGVPSALSPYSSIIYQITRYEPIPIQTSEPIWAQQQMVFGQMNNLLQQLVTSNTVQPLITADQEMTIAGSSVPIDIPNAPILENIPDMTTDEIEVYEDMINVMRGRIRPPKSGSIIGLGDLTMNQPTAQGDREELANILGTQFTVNDDDDDNSTVVGSDNFSLATANVDQISLPDVENINVKDWEHDADSVIHSQGQVAPSYRSRAPTYRTLGTQRTETESEPTPSFRTNASDTKTIVEEEEE